MAIWNVQIIFGELASSVIFMFVFCNHGHFITEYRTR